jgi:TonB family protein
MQWIWADLLIRSAVIFGTAEILRRFPRKLTPADRHRILLAAFGLLLIWPFLSGVMPQIHLPLWPGLRVHDAVTVQQTMFVLERDAPLPNAFNWPIAIWMTGVFLALAPIFIGYLKVLRLARLGVPVGLTVPDGTWQDLLETLCNQLGIRNKPELLIVPGPVMPLTFGLWRPRILLPADSVEWTSFRRRTVLLHEVAHVQRRDITAQLFANVMTALWWFQPLCWTSRWSLRHESERACDALVLASGVRCSEYATELLEIAQDFSTGQRWSSAVITMASRGGDLETRLQAILAPQPARRTTKLSFAAISVLALLTCTASALSFRPEQTDFPGGSPMKRTLLSGLLASAGLSAATIGGSLFDPSGAAIPNAKASLYNPDTAATQEATTTSDGKFMFDGLPAGEYILRVEKPGFASLFREFNVQPDSKVERGLVLKLGRAQEQGNLQAAEGERAAYPQPLNSNQLRIGGEAQESKLIRKVQPVYPVSAKAARVQGKVLLETVISADGVPQEIRVISSPSDDLTQSALDAVRQWRYSSTLLNGTPVEVVTDVLVNYTLSY